MLQGARWVENGLIDIGAVWGMRGKHGTAIRIKVYKYSKHLEFLGLKSAVGLKCSGL